jgi:hypothetical protein
MLLKLCRLRIKRLISKMPGGVLAVGAVALMLMCIEPSWAKAGNLDPGPSCGKGPVWGL